MSVNFDNLLLHEMVEEECMEAMMDDNEIIDLMYDTDTGEPSPSFFVQEMTCADGGILNTQRGLK